MAMSTKKSETEKRSPLLYSNKSLSFSPKLFFFW